MTLDHPALWGIDASLEELRGKIGHLVKCAIQNSKVAWSNFSAKRCRAARIPKRGLNLFGRQRSLFCGLPLRRRLTQALEAAGSADSNLRIRGRGSPQEPEPTLATE